MWEIEHILHLSHILRASIVAFERVNTHLGSFARNF